MEFQEYPRWLYTPEGAFVVADKAEHDKHPHASLVPLDAVVEQPEDATLDRDALLAQADEKGLKVDKRWSDKRLAEELAK